MLWSSYSWVLSNPSQFDKKTQAFLNGKAEQIQIIADFDYTLTQAFNNTERTDVSYSVLLNALDADTRRKSYELFEYYSSHLKDSSLSESSREELMQDWEEKGNQLIIESHCCRDDLVRAVAQSNLTLRKGVRELFEICKYNHIPITVVSAGLGDIIEIVLAEVSSLENLDIRANFIEWDENDRVKGFSKNRIIANRKNRVLAGEAVRPNLIVLGDTCTDVKVLRGCHYESALFVGILLNLDKRMEYEKYFDCLILGDNSIEDVNNWLINIVQYS